MWRRCVSVCTCVLLLVATWPHRAAGVGLRRLQITPQPDGDVVASMVVNISGEAGVSQKELLVRRGQSDNEAAYNFCAQQGLTGTDLDQAVATLVRRLADIRGSQPKIIDAFPYNGEPILELRLALLNDLVDEFVLVEARQTFSGLPKPVMFSERYASSLQPYRDKLTIMVVDFPQPTAEQLEVLSHRYYTNEQSTESWFREHYQRDVIAPYVAKKYAGHRFVLLECDVDEIPNRQVIQMMRTSAELYHMLETPTTLEMSMFFYNFHWRRNHNWLFAYAVNDAGLQHINGQLSYARQHPTQYIPSAGWHGSYFFTATDIVRKLESFAHVEFSGDKYKDMAMIRGCLRYGCNILAPGADSMAGMIPFDVSHLPAQLQEFHAKLAFAQEFA